jgi:hypothetical protein
MVMLIYAVTVNRSIRNLTPADADNEETQPEKKIAVFDACSRVKFRDFIPVSDP